MKKILQAILFLLLCSNAYATDQVVVGNSAFALSASATRYNSFCGILSSTARQCIVSSDGNIKNLRIVLTSAPGAGKSFTFTVQKNLVDTALTCAITDTSTSCSDLSNSFSVSSGDLLLITAVPSGTPTTSIFHFSYIFDSTNDNESIFSEYGGATLNTNTYCPLWGVTAAGACDTSEDDVKSVIATSGTIKNLFVKLTATGVNVCDSVITVNKNGSNTAITCSCVGVTTCTCSDTSNSITVVSGDVITLQVSSGATDTANAGADSSSIGLTFIADTPGDFMLTSNVQSSVSAANTEYFEVQNATGAPTTTEADEDQLGQTMTVKKVYYNAPVSTPGAGKSYLFTLRRNDTTDTAIALTVSDSELADNFAADVTISNDDLLDTSIVPSGTPTALAEFGLTYLACVECAAAATGTADTRASGVWMSGVWIR